MTFGASVSATGATGEVVGGGAGTVGGVSCRRPGSTVELPSALVGRRSWWDDFSVGSWGSAPDGTSGTAGAGLGAPGTAGTGTVVDGAGDGTGTGTGATSGLSRLTGAGNVVVVVDVGVVASSVTAPGRCLVSAGGAEGQKTWSWAQWSSVQWSWVQ